MTLRARYACRKGEAGRAKLIAAVGAEVHDLGDPRSDASRAPNGLELSCPAELGNSPLLYGLMAGEARSCRGPARRVSFSELLCRPPIQERTPHIQSGRRQRRIQVDGASGGPPLCSRATCKS
jgi:hypothetical protein